jgi:hypothetical protein
LHEDDSRRNSPDHAQVDEILVFTKKRELVPFRVFLNGSVRRAAQRDAFGVH